jgi:hypothetical protein
MSTDDDTYQRRTLDERQKLDAREMLGCGWAVRNAAKHFGLSEENFRQQMGMPVWRKLPMDTGRTLFDDGGRQ